MSSKKLKNNTHDNEGKLIRSDHFIHFPTNLNGSSDLKKSIDFKYHNKNGDWVTPTNPVATNKSKKTNQFLEKDPTSENMMRDSKTMKRKSNEMNTIENEIKGNRTLFDIFGFKFGWGPPDKIRDMVHERKKRPRFFTPDGGGASRKKPKTRKIRKKRKTRKRKQKN